MKEKGSLVPEEFYLIFYAIYSLIQTIDQEIDDIYFQYNRKIKFTEYETWFDFFLALFMNGYKWDKRKIINKFS